MTELTARSSLEELAPGGGRDPDSPPRGESLGYLAGLDGIRALAVLGVMFFHAGVSWLPAGFLGVDAFFVLSGFLITTLLLNELRHRATIQLRAFWARRARRLLPALLIVLSFCSLFVWLVARPGSYLGFRSDALATLFYVANWHFIVEHASYFGATSAPSPLTHTWSLAIEEQFYLVWPLALLGLSKLGRGLRFLLGLCVLGAAASAIEMACLLGRGASLTRLYYGTDTHSQCLFVGAALAASLGLIAQRRRARGTVPSEELVMGLGGDPAWAAVSPAARQLLSVAGAAGLLGAALLWVASSWTGTFLFRGGFLLMALLTALVIASAVCHQRGAVARMLSWAPLVFVGRISYGLYLWHYPMFVWLDAARTGLRGPWLLALRFAATFVISVLSFYLVERPIRHGLVLRGWKAGLSTVLAVTATLGLVVAASSAVSVVENPTKGFSTSAGDLHHPVKVLLVGDSVALTLGFPLSQPRFLRHYDAVLDDQGVIGCGIVASDATISQGQEQSTASTCAIHPPAGTPSVSDLLRKEVSSFKPDVVAILAGRWELHDLIVGKAELSIEDRSFQDQVRAGLDEEIAIASAHGAHVLLYTSPCSDSGAQPDGQPWPENSPRRLAIYNDLVRAVAKAHPGTVTVFDLDRLVCPGGRFEATIAGKPVRQADGIHFALDAGEFLGPRLWPALVAAASSSPAYRARSAG